MNKLLIFLIIQIIFFTSGCKTVQEDIVETVITLKDYKETEEIDLLLLEFRLSGIPLYLEKAESRLKAIHRDSIINRDYESIIYGLYGEIECLKNNKNEAEKYLDLIESKSGNHERLFILKALLTDDAGNKIKILETGEKTAGTKDLIRLYLAEIYFQLADYSRSAAYYDDALPALNPRYYEYYGKKRDMAYQFKDTPPKNTEMADFLALETLTVADIITMTLFQTNFLDNITVDKNIDPSILLGKLLEIKYFYNKDISADKVCQRKDVAFFLLSVIAYMENNTSLLSKYANPFPNYSSDSSVPDVATYDYFYTAVLVLVEMEIMELPDGINFFPYDTIDGITYNDILNKLKQMYE